MKTNVKILAGALGMTLVLSICGGVYSLLPHIQSTAEEINFSVEEYTSDDRLLLPDGTLSSRTIVDFSSDVKVASAGDDCSELTQVIPVEYLSTDEEAAVYQYYGQEYGFYLAKEEDCFDLLLIDFVYEFEDEGHSDLEYKIGIDPILQESFKRITNNDGSYSWVKR